MGIPSYFSHIIKNHIQVIKKFENQHFHNLYMDCNSIIYDCVRSAESGTEGSLKKQLCTNICNKIQQYINTIRPSNTVYIAFDGVAPLAKMDQQRSRRVRNAYLEKARIVAKSGFDTTQITPGTEFMNYLANHLNNHYFDGPELVIVSASDEPGEGEHKLFQYIRDNQITHVSQNTAIYGLDADLLMLSLFHSSYTSLYVLREAPEFAKSINANIFDSDSASLYVLDIARFSESICETMPLHDYAFLCFMLGNDFMPHFPAVNIRTHGIQHLIDAYKETGSNRIIGQDGQISWSNFKRIVKWLAKYEEAWIKHEYLQRNDVVIHSCDDKEKMFNNVPLLYRATEHYINPLLPNWRQRYYKALFPREQSSQVAIPPKETLVSRPREDLNVKSVCNNYYEGLEWVYKYYTSSCHDWRWKYKYNYPPLLQDLAMFNPKNVYFARASGSPCSEKEQLAYVMPSADVENTRFEWAWCKYFWEAHLVN